MENTIVNITSCSVTSADTVRLKKLLASEFTEEQARLTTSKSFNGMGDVIIILSIGGGVAIKQFANIVIQWLKSDQGKKIKYKGVEVSGYSAKEVKDILKELQSDE